MALTEFSSRLLFGFEVVARDDVDIVEMRVLSSSCCSFNFLAANIFSKFLFPSFLRILELDLLSDVS